MKTIIKLTAVLTLFLIAIPLEAQTPPKPPKVHHSEHSDSSSSSYSYSVSSSDNKGKNKKTSVSVSISNSEDTYSFSAKFPADKSQEILNTLKKEISNNNLTRSNDRYRWVSESNGDEVYKILFNGTKLSMYLDKEIASSSLEEKFETLGKTIRTIIVGADNEKRREADRLQREADRLQRDAERMQREADRIKHAAQRQAARISNQYKNDAKRIAEEARRIADKASRASREAAHKGGVSSSIRSLLGNDKTYYAEDTASSFNWDWPNLQSDLVKALKEDKLINTDNDLNFTYDNSGIYVNGKKLNSAMHNKYKYMLSKNKLSSTHLFSFYKGHSHIVVLDNNPNFTSLLNNLRAKNLILNKKNKFQINGNSAYRNDEKLNDNDLSLINKLLTQNNIIPAPGKVLEFSSDEDYVIGYRLSSRGFLGTFSHK